MDNKNKKFWYNYKYFIFLMILNQPVYSTLIIHIQLDKTRILYATFYCRWSSYREKFDRKYVQPVVQILREKGTMVASVIRLAACTGSHTSYLQRRAAIIRIFTTDLNTIPPNKQRLVPVHFTRHSFSDADQ